MREIVYGFDSLCGWCYGFRPAFEALRVRFLGRVRWRVASAGLVTGDRERPIAEMRDYMRRGIPDVEARTGVTFGTAFVESVLEEGAWVSRSEPGIRGVVLAETMAGDPGVAVTFASALSEALYAHGLVPDGEPALSYACHKAGLDTTTLVGRFGTHEAKAAAKAHMDSAARMGVSVYPSMHLVTDTGTMPLFEGCLGVEAAAAAIDKALHVI